MEVLDAVEARVLGALVEKDITTPDYYPLSLNSLINACNQKSNRAPVMTLDEESVRDAMSRLEDKRLAGPASGADSRVMKYEHRVYDIMSLGRPEVAVLCELLLRGPQTIGELRGHADRMHHFDGLDQVQSTLQRLMEREPQLVKILPRKPGTKESRYTELMTGDVQGAEFAESSVEATAAEDERVSRLEGEVLELRTRVSEVERQLESFRKQFE